MFDKQETNQYDFSTTKRKDVGYDLVIFNNNLNPRITCGLFFT